MSRRGNDAKRIPKMDDFAVYVFHALELFVVLLSMPLEVVLVPLARLKISVQGLELVLVPLALFHGVRRVERKT